MDLPKNVRENDRLTSTVLALALSVFALLSLRRGQRLRGALAGLGAVAFGYRASTESGDGAEHSEAGLDTEPAVEPEQERCAICGDPIVAGELRTPNENNDIVHEACQESAA